MRIVVPRSLTMRVYLRKDSPSHKGIQRCQERTLSSVWWHGISSQIYDMVQRCPTCSKMIISLKEPMIYSQLPENPFQKIERDFFEKRGITNLLVVDYFLHFQEIIKLTSTMSNGVITGLKSLFSRYDIPEEMVSDNVLQYIFQEMKDFAKSYTFKHITSIPHYPQGNG